MTEEEILQLIRIGGRAADTGFKALYDEMARPFMRFFVHRGLSQDEAQDVLQDAFIKIYFGADSYAGQGTAKAWIWQVARNCLTDHLRKTSRLKARETIFDDADWTRLLDKSADPAPVEAHVTVDECVTSGLLRFGQTMPDRAYVLTLQMEGVCIEDIANRIDRTVAATKEYLSQCRKKLKPLVARCMELLTA